MNVGPKLLSRRERGSMEAWAMGGQLVVYQPYAGSNPIASAMSRSRGRVKHE